MAHLPPFWFFLLRNTRSLAFKVIVFFGASSGSKDGSSSAKYGDWSANDGSGVVTWFICFLSSLSITELSNVTVEKVIHFIKLVQLDLMDNSIQEIWRWFKSELVVRSKCFFDRQSFFGVFELIVHFLLVLRCTYLILCSKEEADRHIFDSSEVNCFWLFLSARVFCKRNWFLESTSDGVLDVVKTGLERYCRGVS